MRPSARMIVIACALCLCAAGNGCKAAQRAPRTLIEPTWSHHDEAASVAPAVTAAPRKPWLESLLNSVPIVSFN